MPDYGQDEQSLLDYKKRVEEAKEAARIAQEKATKKKQAKDKKEFKAWLETGAGYCPASYCYDRVNGDYFTVKGDKIVTSQGAECPLDHVKKAIWFYEGRRIQTGSLPKNKYPFNPYQTNGHKIPLGIFTLEQIDEAGNVKAGCHTFRAATIQQFIKTHRRVLGL